MIRVQLRHDGAWVVCVGANQRPVSEHASTTDAERAAHAYAARLGYESFLVVDAYHRLRAVPCQPRLARRY